MLRRGGLRVHVAPIASSAAAGDRRRAGDGCAQSGARGRRHGVGLAGAEPPARGRCTTLRVVLDTPSRELRNPLHDAHRHGDRLPLAAPGLRRWSRSGRRRSADREVVLASPRASCAGVERAVEIVERALEQYGAPVYVRKQIVHNAHVVGSLRGAAARCSSTSSTRCRRARPSSSPPTASRPRSARNAEARQLNVIDATCPLVAKVHAEARRFAAGGFDIVLVGHEGHEEVEGTFGEAPERTTVIASAEDVARLQVSDPEHVAYLTQTTLAVDETASVVGALRERFPAAVGPPSERHLLRDPEPPGRRPRARRATAI